MRRRRGNRAQTKRERQARSLAPKGLGGQTPPPGPGAWGVAPQWPRRKAAAARTCEICTRHDFDEPNGNGVLVRDRHVYALDRQAVEEEDQMI